MLLIGLAVGILVVLGAAWYFTRSQPEPDVPTTPVRKDPLAGLPAKVRDPKAQLGEDFELYVLVGPGETRSANLEADRSLIAVFDVTPMDGSILAAAMNVKSVIHLTPEIEAALQKEARPAKKGAPTLVHCEAAAREMIGCFLRNPGSTTVNVRVRRRWWGLEEQRLPTEQEVHIEDKTLALGGQLEMILSSERSAKGSIEIIPKSGTVSASLIPLTAVGDDLSEEEKRRAEAGLTNVSPPQTLRLEYQHHIGDASYCLIRNRTDLLVRFQIKHTTGLSK